MTHAMRFLISMMALVAFAAAETEGPPMNDEFLIAIHGGGGVRSQAEMTPELEGAYRDALRAALEPGHDVRSGGGNSVSAVEAAIRVMEDSPLFNAGKGGLFVAAMAVIPGSAFGPSGEGYIRVTCVRSWEEVEKGLERLRKAIC